MLKPYIYKANIIWKCLDVNIQVFNNWTACYVVTRSKIFSIMGWIKKKNSIKVKVQILGFDYFSFFTTLFYFETTQISIRKRFFGGVFQLD